MSDAVDLIVVGAGPAGAAAAIEAAHAGLRVILVDESETAGGQVYRAPAMRAEQTSPDPDAQAGEQLRAELAASAVDTRFDRRVWLVSEGFRVDALAPEGPESATAQRLLVATGAYERVVPFPGWTLPGVVGLAAATILLKSQSVLPGRRLLVAGTGPLLAAVAVKAAERGADVLAVVDMASRAEWLRAAGGLSARPDLLGRGAGWALGLMRRGVPILHRHAVRRAEGDEEVRRVVIGPVDGTGAPADGPERAFEVDAVAVGHGLTPGSEIPRLLRARHVYDALRGGWAPETDADGRTSVEGLYAVGDGAGLRGALPAALAGRLAGLAIAREAGAIADSEHRPRRAQLGAELARADRAGRASARLMTMRLGQVAAIPPDCVVCRCEDVTRDEIDAALEAGAADVNQLKHFTRCGMGPCQGRMCGDVVGALVGQRVGGRERAGYWTGRPPIRPVPLDALLGSFSYDDIPIPEPAPL